MSQVVKLDYTGLSIPYGLQFTYYLYLNVIDFHHTCSKQSFVLVYLIKSNKICLNENTSKNVARPR